MTSSKRDVYCVDSWFGSVRMAEAQKCTWRTPKPVTHSDPRDFAMSVDKQRGTNPDSHEVICSIKTGSAYFPKRELEKEMKDYPSGAYLVLETTAPVSNVKLVAIGYKYNARKVLLFLMTKDAGMTLPGRPYIARFNDEFGNLKSRQVERPDCISTYFAHANAIDIHNHYRQGLLGLEQHWRTTNLWFRIACSVIGMTVVDCYLACKHHVPKTFNHRSLADFVDSMAYNLVANNFGKEVSNETCAGGTRTNLISTQPAVFSNLPTQSSNADAVLMLVNALKNATIGGDLPGTLGSVLSPSSLSDVNGFSAEDESLPGNRDEFDHTVVPNDTTTIETDGRERPVKRRCVICGGDTRYMCSHPTCRAQEKHIGDTSFVGCAICKDDKIRRGYTTTCIMIHKQRMSMGNNK